MILIVTLADNHYNIRRLGIHQVGWDSELLWSHLFHLLSLILQSLKLKGYKVICEDGINKAIDRQIHLHPRMQVHILFHITNRLAVEVTNHALLVGNGVAPSNNQEG